MTEGKLIEKGYFAKELFNTDFIICYSVDDYLFTPMDDDNNKLLIWFLEGIPELLAFAYSATMSSYEDLDEYFSTAKKGIGVYFW